MKKFKCTVERVNEYIIEFDENILNEKWLEGFKKCFYNFDNLEEHAKHLAQFKARFPDHSFIEGYGVPLVNSRKPVFADENSLNPAINIKVVSEDTNVEIYVQEVE